MIERRQAVRKQVNIPMKISLFEKKEEYENSIQFEGNAKDISINGFGLEMKISCVEIWEKLRNFTPDTKKSFLLRLEVLASEKKLWANGTIAWCHVTDLEKKELRIGIFLNRMDAIIREEWYQYLDKL